MAAQEVGEAQATQIPAGSGVWGAWPGAGQPPRRVPQHLPWSEQRLRLPWAVTGVEK